MGKLAAAGRVVVILVLALTASACATVTMGTTQEILVESDPAGAECRIDRKGANVAVVKETPGKVIVSRSKENVTVICDRDGYARSSEIVEASFTGATIGNVIAGGIVGVMVDAASGANNKYPERMLVVMMPSSFPDDAARDRYFNVLKERIQSKSEAEIKRINDNCSSTNREICQLESRQVAELRDKALLEVDRKRADASVVPAS
jgi:hypothetical protein